MKNSISFANKNLYASLPKIITVLLAENNLVVIVDEDPQNRNTTERTSYFLLYSIVVYDNKLGETIVLQALLDPIVHCNQGLAYTGNIGGANLVDLIEDTFADETSLVSQETSHKYRRLQV